jgi:hypothetical protein
MDIFGLLTQIGAGAEQIKHISEVIKLFWDVVQPLAYKVLRNKSVKREEIEKQLKRVVIPVEDLPEEVKKWFEEKGVKEISFSQIDPEFQKLIISKFARELNRIRNESDLEFRTAKILTAIAEEIVNEKRWEGEKGDSISIQQGDESIGIVGEEITSSIMGNTINGGNVEINIGLSKKKLN